MRTPNWFRRGLDSIEHRLFGFGKVGKRTFDVKEGLRFHLNHR